MPDQLDQDWLQGRASLGAAAGWVAEEMRLVAEIGYALAEQGRNTEAVTVFEGLAALAPATGYFQAALGALALRMGDPQRAIAHLNAALAADSRDTAALVNRGEAYLQIGNEAMARKDLAAAARHDPAQQSMTLDLCRQRARALLARLGDMSSKKSV